MPEAKARSAGKWVLWLAALVVTAAAVSAAALVLAASTASALTLRDKVHSAIAKGNKLYDSGEHEQALDEYRKAREADSLSAIPRFNSGDALYKLGKFKEGAGEFLKTASASSDSIAAMSYYNLGNTAFKSGDYGAAAEAYKRSLLMDPDDEDAKFNLEYAMRMLKREQQDQNQQNQDQNQQQDQQDQQQNQQQDQQNQEQDRQDQQAQQDQAGQDNQQNQQPQTGRGEMTPDELKRILAAIDASDRETQQELLRQAARTRRLTERDW